MKCVVFVVVGSRYGLVVVKEVAVGRTETAGEGLWLVKNVVDCLSEDGGEAAEEVKEEEVMGDDDEQDDDEKGSRGSVTA